MVHCNIVSNDYEDDSITLCTFIPHKSFVLLFDLSPKTFIFLKTFNSEFLCIEVCFTDQSSKELKIEDKIKLLDHAKQFVTDALNTALKRAIQKRAESISGLTDNKSNIKVIKNPPKNNS